MAQLLVRPETIIALASGSGRAGVAVVRLSGPDAGTVLSRLFHVKQSTSLPQPRRATVRVLIHPVDGRVLDEGLVLWMPGPDSFTGEDVVELQVHGGIAIVAAILDAGLATGLCRMAEPGEFTRRAFEHGRLDLTQAEALGDLIDSETEGQRVQAQRVFRGESGRRFDEWRDRLIRAMAALEASIDFPDEADIPEDVVRSAVAPLEALELDLGRALHDWHRMRSVREGFRIAILGKPNVGKSSLLNQLAGREAAIVSDIPGTTRDVVEVRLVLSGFPVWVADTAGLREAADVVEAEGVRRALERARDADLRLWVIDASDRAVGAESVSRETSFLAGDLVLLNKADLLNGPFEGCDLAISASLGQGIGELMERLAGIVRDRLSSEEPPMITRVRQHALVEEALAHVRAALDGSRAGAPAELVSEDLRMAARALGRITGSVDVEDLLDRIFGDFCIGK